MANEGLNHKHARFAVIFSAVSLVVGVVVSYVYFSRIYFTTDQIPQEIASLREKASFTLYYPAELPEGFVLSASSVRLENGVLLYSLEKNGSSLTVSIQKKPNEQITVGNSANNTAVKHVTNEYGSGTIGTFQGTAVGIFTTDNELVSLIGTEQVSSDSILQAIVGLEPLSL